VHPEGMPEFICDPSGVGGRLLDRRPGGVAALDLRLLSGKPSAWLDSDREPPIPPQRTRRQRFDVMRCAPHAGSLAGTVGRLRQLRRFFLESKNQ